MSSILQVSCDKCGSAVLVNRTKLRVECGPLRPRREEIDLCPACADALVNWLRVAPLDTPHPELHP